MKAVGIIAEYNPFHRGHGWHIAETRRLLGDNKPVICVMSGNWVQRGECALVDKWERAEMALRGGADLVLELPLPWAISSAEQFAKGGVEILRATGVVDTLSFGSESGEIGKLQRIAEGLESKDYQSSLRTITDKGISFAEARQRAVISCLGKDGELLKNPNDNLGVEYLRAAGRSMEAIAVRRMGAAHDGAESLDGYASATLLRQMARRGAWEEMKGFLAREDLELIKAGGTADMERMERALLTRLRTMKEEEFSSLPDCGAAEGLPSRMKKAAKKAESLEAFYSLVKTRRYTHARIRRLALWAFLGLEEKDRPAAGPSYLRVLGMNEQGKGLLREMKKTATLPIITKPSHIRGLGGEAQHLFALECRGTDLYGLCFDTIRPCGLEYTTGPICL